MTPNAQTLAHRFAAGRMPLGEVLRYGSQLIDCIRHAHEEGRSHGALTPAAVVLTPTGVELIAADPAVERQVTPYTAPECLAGHEPDACSDIFSLGAILYEMFTGRRAFSGDSPQEIAAAIEHYTPELIGETALDRLVSNCLVKDPAGRWQRVQQVQLEFRVLMISAKRNQHFAVPRQADHALRSELRQLESTLMERLDQRSAQTAEELRQLSAQLPLLEAQLTARLDRQNGDIGAALRQVTAELPQLQAHLTSQLAERHGELQAALQHLAAEMEGRVAARLQQHEGAIASMQQSIANLPQLESKLEARIQEHDRALAGLPELHTQLNERLSRYEGAMAAAQQSITGLPEVEAKLTSRMDEHDRALAGVPELQARLSEKLDHHEQALTSVQQSMGGLPQLASRLASQVEQHNAALDTVAQSVMAASEQIVSIEAKVNAAHAAAQHSESGASQLADMQGALLDEVKAFSSTIQQHAASIESIRASLARTDDFMERVVEALESLQSMVLEQARDRVGA